MTPMKLCDIHTHILPGVDDGAPDMSYALQMLENAVASDVEWLAVTPHCNVSPMSANYWDDALRSRFAQLQQAAKDIPIHLVLGAEVRVTEELPLLLAQGHIPTINGGRYVLTEFAMHTADSGFMPILAEMRRQGFIPLVAHPERYEAVRRNPSLVEEWLDCGCHLQLTGGSLIGSYGKTVQRTASTLLRHDWVACIASDAHGIHQRSNFMLDVYDHLFVQYSRSYADCLLYTNPLRIIKNDIL